MSRNAQVASKEELDKITGPIARYRALRGMLAAEGGGDYEYSDYQQTLQEAYAARFGEGRRILAIGPRFILSRCPRYCWIYDRVWGTLHRVRLRAFLRYRQNHTDNEWAACEQAAGTVVRWRADQRDLRAIPGFVEGTWATGLWARISYDKRRKRQGTYGVWLNRLSVAIAGESVLDMEVDHLWGDTEADFAWWLQPLPQLDHQAKERMEDYWQYQALKHPQEGGLGYVPDDLTNNDTARAYADDPGWDEMAPPWATVEELLAIAARLENEQTETDAESAAICLQASQQQEPVQAEVSHEVEVEGIEDDRSTPVPLYPVTFAPLIVVGVADHRLRVTASYSLAGHPDQHTVSATIAVVFIEQGRQASPRSPPLR